MFRKIQRREPFKLKKLTLACGLLLSHDLLAQQLEEIVVTAERRETVLQDTPLSILAFSSDALQQKGIETMEDLGANSPNLDIKGTRGNGNLNPTYQIRGIAGGGGATGERGVGFYLDGVFVPRQTGPYMQVLDLERIEVLRGPQGTLFGRNSLGGAIRVFTQQPSDVQEGYVEVTAGNYDRREITGMLNVPVSDSFSLRGQLALLEQEGYVDRGPQRLGGNENLIARLRGRWTPSENVIVTGGAMYLDSESDGNPQDLISFDMDPVDPINGVSDVISYEGGYADWVSDFLENNGQERLRSHDPRLLLDDYTMPSYCFLDNGNPDWHELCEQTNESSYTQLDMNVRWMLSPNTEFSSITGYSKFDSRGIADWPLLGMERRTTEVDSWTFYQEFQLHNTLFDGALDLITGLNYFHESSEQPNHAILQATGTSIFGAMGLPITTPTNQNPNGNAWAGINRNDDVAIDQESDSWGIFANGTWHVNERFNVTAGLRFAYDQKDFEQTEYASSNFIPAPGTTSTTVSADDSWTEVDWRLTGDYRFNEALMMFATVSKAYRAGAFSYETLDEVPGPEQSGDFISAIPPEKVINREIGLRSDLLDGRLRFNLTWFDMDYSDRQSAAAAPDPSAPTGFSIQLTNQGDVDIDGLELETQFAVTDRFSLNASAGLVDTKVSDPCVNNGFHLYPSPSEKSYQLGGLYDLDLASQARLRFSMNYTYVGKQQTHSGGMDSPSGCASSGGPFPPTPEWFVDSRYELDGYGLLNARVTYTSANQRWQISAFGNNLTDKTYGNFATRFGGGYWEGGPPAPINLKAPERSAVSITRGRPLNWGLSLRYSMGQL